MDTSKGFHPRKSWLYKGFLYNWDYLNCIIAPAPPRKTGGKLYKDVDADYYGYRDEDDGVLVPLEQDLEKEGWFPLKEVCHSLILSFSRQYQNSGSPMLLPPPPAMWASQGVPWLLHLLILSPVLCFLNQRGSYCTKKMLSNCPAEKYTCVVNHSPPILESRELIYWLCSHLALYFTKMPVGLWSTFGFTLFANLAAIARAMEEWERKKEEGEVGNEPETEEENIYAVSKEQEVHCRHYVTKFAQALIGQLSLRVRLGRCWVEMRCGTVFGDAITIFFLRGCAGKWLKIRPQNIPIVQFDSTPIQA